MVIQSGPFKIRDHKKDCFRISITGSLTGIAVENLREEISKCVKNDFDIIYLDVKEVTEADLSGINEVIHSHYTLDKVSKKLILLYKKGSPIEKWVETTGFDKFVSTAIIPSI